MDKIFLSYLEKIELALHDALPDDCGREWLSASFQSLPPSVTAEHIENLTAPCKSLLNLGGKRWRPLLLVLCAELARESGRTGGLSEAELYGVTPLVEFAHTASLIHDDIEDSSSERRGQAAAHIRYGLDTALNAGSWLYFEGAACIDRLKGRDAMRLELYSLYAGELRRLHLGQAMDIYWHRSPQTVPREEEYAAMVRCKTGTLSSLAARIGVTAGGGARGEAREAGRIASEIGEGFQILDDVQNLTTGNPGKKRGDDIVEGKKSLPVILHLSRRPEDREKVSRCMARAAAGGIESPAVEECIAILESCGAVSDAHRTGLDLIRTKSAELAGLFGTRESAPSARLIEKLFSDMTAEVKDA